MLALARAGRPVESLRAYDEFRRFLADEVGVVPSPGLQELNDDIVRQHPDVSWSGSRKKDAGTVALPSGTVTFLFTDVEGSTRLWDEYPDVMRNAMARHDEILRVAIAAHDGHVVKSAGDGFLAVFATVHDAVTAAVAAQLALLDDDWNITETVRVRMGDPYGRRRDARRRLLGQRGEPRRAPDVGGTRRTDRRVIGDAGASPRHAAREVRVRRPRATPTP